MKREKNGNLTLATLPSWIRLQMFSFLLRKLPSFRNSVFFSCLEASLNARAIVSEKKTGRKWCWKLSADCIYHFIFHIIYKSFSIHPNKFDTPYQEFSRLKAVSFVDFSFVFLWDAICIWMNFYVCSFFLAIISVVKKLFMGLVFVLFKKLFFLKVQFLGEGRHQNIGSESQQHILPNIHFIHPVFLYLLVFLPGS